MLKIEAKYNFRFWATASDVDAASVGNRRNMNRCVKGFVPEKIVCVCVCAHDVTDIFSLFTSQTTCCPNGRNRYAVLSEDWKSLINWLSTQVYGSIESAVVKMKTPSISGKAAQKRWNKIYSINFEIGSRMSQTWCLPGIWWLHVRADVTFAIDKHNGRHTRTSVAISDELALHRARYSVQQVKHHNERFIVSNWHINDMSAITCVREATRFPCSSRFSEIKKKIRCQMISLSSTAYKIVTRDAEIARFLFR